MKIEAPRAKIRLFDQAVAEVMMSAANEKIVCETPTHGKQPTRIDRWKYEAVRDAILEILPTSGEGIAFKDLIRLASERLDEDVKARIGSVSWYTTTVKLDLECKGQIERVPGSRPQRLVRVG